MFTQTVNPGEVADFSMVLAPANGVYPRTVTFAVTGLPTGATATFSPSTLAADSGAQTVTLAVQTAGMSASNVLRNDLRKNREITFEAAGISLGILLLPFAFTKRLKRARTTLAGCVIISLFLLGGVTGMAGLSGCGGQSARTYTLVVTATSGSVKHSFDFILTVQ